TSFQSWIPWINLLGDFVAAVNDGVVHQNFYSTHPMRRGANEAGIDPMVSPALYWSDGTQSLACGEMLRNGGLIFGELF
ncbi:MAG: hypothetical protein ACKON9_14135, partial [Planctomycetaceae bacterium]